jgi:hypothetical protein
MEKKREPALVAIRTEKGKPFRQFPRNLRLFFSLHRSKVCTQTNIWEREREESLLRAMDVSIPIDNWISFQSLHSTTRARGKRKSFSTLIPFPPFNFWKEKRNIKYLETGPDWHALAVSPVCNNSGWEFVFFYRRFASLRGVALRG